MSEHINGWNDLQKYGINALTGEACAYSMRLLCDLNEDGEAHVREFFGLPYETKFADNWNSSVGGKKSVGSIMLPRRVFTDLSTFILFSMGCQYVVVIADGTVVGYNADDIEKYKLTYERLTGLHDDVRFNPRNPAIALGSRNIHAMTGRII